MRLAKTPILFVVFAFLTALGSESEGQDAHSLTRHGGQMTVDEKAALEQQVTKDPSNIEARTKLLGYYFIKGRWEPDAKSARLRHVKWLIENAPQSAVLGLPHSHLDKILEPEGYDHAKQAWLKVLQESPENLAVLENASKFFLLHDREFSEELLLKGQELDAKDPKWPASLGQLYSLRMALLPEGPARTAAAQKAFHQFKLAHERSEPSKKDFLLPDLAKTALDAGRIDEAKNFAEKMLDDDSQWNRGNRIHHGNLILGRIALSQGDVDEAKSRLLLAGKTSGSPNLDSFGPNMLLAKELLQRGETEVVLQYFELCKNFWTSPRRQLDQWADDVKANRIPQFGGNLMY